MAGRWLPSRWGILFCLGVALALGTAGEAVRAQADPSQAEPSQAQPAQAEPDTSAGQPARHGAAPPGQPVLRVREKAPEAPILAPVPPGTVEADLPELMEFRRVVFELWEEAWPRRDIRAIADRLPEVQYLVTKLIDVPVPESIMDRKAQWNAAVANLEISVQRYEKTVEDGDSLGRLQAVEFLQARFREIDRVLHPRMRELDSFYVPLHGLLYHYLDRADDDLIGVKNLSGALVNNCETLMQAPVPTVFSSREGDLRKAYADLCEATAELRAQAEAQDIAGIQHAAARVHALYRRADQMFD